jgi:hypothetical protein
MNDVHPSGNAHVTTDSRDQRLVKMIRENGHLFRRNTDGVIAEVATINPQERLGVERVQSGGVAGPQQFGHYHGVVQGHGALRGTRQEFSRTVPRLLRPDALHKVVVLERSDVIQCQENVMSGATASLLCNRFDLRKVSANRVKDFHKESVITVMPTVSRYRSSIKAILGNL